MPSLDVRTRSGDIYVLDDLTLVYGDAGIALKLTERNMRNVLRACTELTPIKDLDSRQRRFTASYDMKMDNFLFQPYGGLDITVKAFDLFQDEYLKAA